MNLAHWSAHSHTRKIMSRHSPDDLSDRVCIHAMRRIQSSNVRKSNSELIHLCAEIFMQ